MEEIICPSCENPIYDDDALSCHYCGGSLKRAGRGLLSRMRYGKHKIWLYVIVFFILCGFVSLFI